MSAYGRKYGGQGLQGRTRAGALAVAAALVLLILSAVDQTLLMPLRNFIVGWSGLVVERGAGFVEPVRAFVGLAVAPFSNAEEIGRLRAENTRLKAAAIRLEELEQDNRDLGRMLKLSPGPAIESVAARVIGVAPDLVAATITIGAGLDQRVGLGDAVVANDVLFGRVVRLGAGSATVVRLVDARSRVPVVVGHKQIRAILTGDGSSAPRLEFISPAGGAREGDSVMTSGVGGVIARGLIVGRVIADSSGWRVELPAGHDVPRTVAVLRFTQPDSGPSQPTEDTAGRVDAGQGFGPGLSLLERRRFANRARAGGSP